MFFGQILEEKRSKICEISPRKVDNPIFFDVEGKISKCCMFLASCKVGKPFKNYVIYIDVCVLCLCFFLWNSVKIAIVLYAWL